MYKVVQSFDFLMQATRVLNLDKYDDFDINIIYQWVNLLSDETLHKYNWTNTIPSYVSDLELLVDIINSLINIYESNENYEKCNVLFKLKNKIKMMSIIKIDV